MAGGALQSCSSVSPKNCLPETVFSNARSGPLFRVSSSAITQIADPDGWHSTRTDQAKIAGFLLQTLLRSAGEAQMTKEDLLNVMEALYLNRSGEDVSAQVTELGIDHYQRNYPENPVVLHGQTFLDGLDDREYYRILDWLEVGQRGADGTRLQEKTKLERSKNPHALSIYKQFVEMAKTASGTSQPTIVVITASSRDPFEAVDFYKNIFEDAGAQAHWLGVTAALQKARQHKKCDALVYWRGQIQGSFNREAVFPELVQQQNLLCRSPSEGMQLLRKADGVFLNGGDQSLTRAALLAKDGSDYPEMALIRSRLAAGNLVLGGTSAGTAVQSARDAAMISNGGNLSALREGAVAAPAPTPGCQRSQTCEQGLHSERLTYHASGGLGTFSLGTLDTHFSERNRQWRLLTLLKDSATEWGFGVDETTALLSSYPSSTRPTRLKVLGDGGVWIARHHTTENGINKAIIHYLGDQDSAIFSNDNLTANLPTSTHCDSLPISQSVPFGSDIFGETLSSQLRRSKGPLSFRLVEDSMHLLDVEFFAKHCISKEQASLQSYRDIQMTWQIIRPSAKP